VLAQIRKARQEESGFTLIELLMVIVILGILSGIVVFAVNGIQDKGAVSACKANVNTVTTAVEAFYANTPGTAAYPADQAAAVTALVPKYLHSWPTGVTYTVAAGAPVVTGAGC
jgi:general secretion pathway protein G